MSCGTFLLVRQLLYSLLYISIVASRWVRSTRDRPNESNSCSDVVGEYAASSEASSEVKGAAAAVFGTAGWLVFGGSLVDGVLVLNSCVVECKAVGVGDGDGVDVTDDVVTAAQSS